ncbi:MAG: hypothetical protein ACRDVG_13280 [Jatrophihabitantaceae bacterium]
MKLFHRRDEPPAEVVAHLPADERIVSWADVEGGDVVLATPAGLWWPGGDAPRLIGWPRITKAIWRDGRLTVIEADVVDDLLLVDREPLAVALSVPRDLPPVVRKRIEANVVRTQLLPVGGGSARFVARRIPGEDGVRWWVRLEDGTPDTNEVRAEIEARLASLRAAHEAQTPQ